MLLETLVWGVLGLGLTIAGVCFVIELLGRTRLNNDKFDRTASRLSEEDRAFIAWLREKEGLPSIEPASSFRLMEPGDSYPASEDSSGSKS